MEPASSGWNLIFFAVVALQILLLVLTPLFVSYVPDHYIYLARSLVQGQLTVDELPDFLPDVVYWQGHKYVPFAPLPAVLLIPFLPLLNAGVQLAWIGLLVTLANIVLFYRVLGQAGIVGQRRNWALLLFFGGTNYFSVTFVGVSWYFAQLLVITCVLLLISETLGKARPLVIGILVGLAAMSRTTAIVALIFPLWMLGQGMLGQGMLGQGMLGRGRKGVTAAELARTIGLLSLGLAGPVLLLLVYNYARFGSPLESGYGIAVLSNAVLEQAREHGTFSIVHIPKALFMMLLQGPLPYPSADAPVLQFPYVHFTTWGMGIFWTSPALLWAFRAKLGDRLVQAAWLSILFIMIPLITYYGIGPKQFGFRYALDFMPFLLIIVARGLPSPPGNAPRILILASVLINIWGALWLVTAA